MGFLRSAEPQRRRERPLSLSTALLSTALADELTTGLLVAGLPLVHDRLHLTYAQVGFLFTAGSLSSLLIEPFIDLFSDRSSKRRPVTLGLLGLVVAYVLAGAAPGYGWLLLAFIVLFPANGAAVGVAQAALMQTDADRVGPTMARWAVLAGIGDLLGPAAIGALVGAGLQWPAVCLVGAGCWAVLLVWIAPRRFPAVAAAPAVASIGDAEDQPPISAFAALRLALRDAQLLRWVGIELGATMLDEVFIGFVALYLHDGLEASTSEVGLLLLPGAVAAVLSLMVLDRLLHRLPAGGDGLRLLPLLALVALSGVAVLIAAPNRWYACAGLVIAELGAAGWYPISRAAAYARYPGRPGLVHAVFGLMAPFELVLPAVVGTVAAQFGIRAAVSLLGLAPLLVLLLAPYRRRGCITA